jgi:hypothetical protein
MLKTISAALLAVSVFAAPALAAGTEKTAQSPVAKSVQVKPSVLNANAKTGRHHFKHATHHGNHKRMAVHKTHRHSKIATKHVAHPTKRG